MLLYEILNIDKNASSAEIKKAYKKLALQYHPDKNNGTTESKFYAISAAYNVLSDPDKKAKYDLFSYVDKEDDYNNTNDQYLPNNLPPQFHEAMKFANAINSLCSKIFSSDNTLFHNLQNDIELDDMIEKNNNEITDSYLFNTIKKHFNIELNRECSELDSERLYESDFTNSDQLISNASDIVMNIETTIGEIYKGKIKVITFNRQCFKNKKMIIEQATINIPVCDDMLILENEGNDYINDDGKLVRGRVIVHIKCLHSKYYKRVNEYDIMLLSHISTDEVNNGYNKKLKYFDSTVTIKCKDPKNKLASSQYDDRIINKIPECGLTYYKNGDIKNPYRGDLIVILFIEKTN